jgi:hypothetical protein
MEVLMQDADGYYHVAKVLVSDDPYESLRNTLLVPKSVPHAPDDAFKPR